MRRKLFLFFFFGTLSILCLLLLRFPAQAGALAANGLTLWFSKMIPALFPFMILSGLFLSTGFSNLLARLAAPVLQPVFQTTEACLFCILTGFFCGFPMGARVCAQSLQQKKISRREASWLLAFINNIGPVYFSGLCPDAVSGAYSADGSGLVCICCRFCTELCCGTRSTAICRRKSVSRVFVPASVRCQANTPASPTGTPLSSACLLSALHESILSAMNGIAQLGGYMVFFNLLNLFPTVFLAAYPAFMRTLSPLLEITNGLSMLLPSERLWAYIVLPFGGLCCIAQTASCIHKNRAVAEIVHLS